MDSDTCVILDVVGRPSPWANEPYEGAWREAIARQVREQLSNPFGPDVKPTSVTVEFRLALGRRGDLDNLAKPVLDTLFRQSRRSKYPVACVFECDDFRLDELILRRQNVETAELEGARITILVQELGRLSTP